VVERYPQSRYFPQPPSHLELRTLTLYYKSDTLVITSQHSTRLWIKQIGFLFLISLIILLWTLYTTVQCTPHCSLYIILIIINIKYTNMTSYSAIKVPLRSHITLRPIYIHVLATQQLFNLRRKQKQHCKEELHIYSLICITLTVFMWP
jgi:hypothetical protein